MFDGKNEFKSMKMSSGHKVIAFTESGWIIDRIDTTDGFGINFNGYRENWAMSHQIYNYTDERKQLMIEKNIKFRDNTDGQTRMMRREAIQ
jgi:hypothetical protein